MLGKELRKARHAADLSQEQVAVKARISREYLSYIENDRKSPTVGVLLRICKAMNVSASQIIARIEQSGRR